MTPKTIHDLPTPALLLDLDVLERNLRRMADRAERLGVRLRPHVKTHKCPEVAGLQREAGARGITVSTLYEARVFADHGFEDMTWAFPVIPSRLREARELAETVRLRLLVDGPEAVELLEAAGHPSHVWLEVDCGHRRSGVDPESPALVELAGALADSTLLRFDGLLTHSGQAYTARSPWELAAVAEEERSTMAGAAERLREAGIAVPSVSVGSTPAMSAVRSLEGVDEARPGNYALHDYTQVALGACGIQDCAATVLSTVVSSRPGASHCVVDAGALSLSKDRGPGAAAGEDEAGMGRIFGEYGNGVLREDARLVSLSQEHGVVDGRLPYGERIRILPNHSCLAVANFDVFHAVRGEEVVGAWRIRRGRDDGGGGADGR